MKRSTFYEHPALFFLAFLLAGAVRLIALGTVPLSNSEAELALQALNLSRGQAALLGPHPLYLVLTTATFALFQASEVWARFWPALVGSLIVWVPFLFRRRLGWLPSLLMAFFLALDPSLVTISRLAGSPIFAITFLLLGLGFWENRRSIPAGICAGLALLGGPGIWQGIAALALAWWAAASLQTARVEPEKESDTQEPEAAPAVEIRGNSALRLAGWFALGTVAFVGSMFLFIPQGLSAAAASLPAYLQSWVSTSGVPMVRPMQALFFYELLPLVWGLISIFVHRQKSITLFLGLWWLVALLVAVVPPGRQVTDLAWSMIPLWALAAVQLAQMFRRPAEDMLPVAGQALLSLVILAFLSMSLIGVTNNAFPTMQESALLVGLAGSLALLVATTLLVAWGWSGRVALYGLSWAITVLLAVYMISAAWYSAGFSRRAGVELWAAEPVFVDNRLFEQTVKEIALWNTGVPDQLDMAVVNLSTPALQWVLRDQQNVTFVNSLPASAAPAFVVTPDASELALAATYRGQDFILAEQPVWEQNDLRAWFRWLAFREVPHQSSPVVLWARTDLFADDTGK